jgi:predicted dehydrogenase
VHSFDLVRFLTGAEVARVWCRTSRVVTTRTEDNFVATFDLDRQRRARVREPVAGPPPAARASSTLPAGTPRSSPTISSISRTASGASSGRRSTCRRPCQTVRATLESFAALLEAGTPPPTTLTDGVCSVMIAEACMRSAAEGRAVDVPAVAP